MIIGEKQKNLHTTGLDQRKEFTLKANGHAFRALSDSLYSDKPGSIVRELYSNAYDSHVLAGKANQPAEIHLPEPFESAFWVRDFGVGLSYQDVTNLYSTYFESTKTGSNDAIGGFGLGSKTPFAYTDQFLVTSWHDGVKRTYSCFINDKGVPEVALLTEEPTTEPSGMRVSFQIKPGDTYRFQTAIAQQLAHFTPRPTIKGSGTIHWPTKTKVLSGKDWTIYQTQSYTNGEAVIVVGQVGYPIDHNHQDLIDGLSPEVIELLQMDFELRVPIGSVDVTVSREALSLNKKTISYLKNRLPKVLDEVAAEVAKQAKSLDTKYAKRQKIYSITRLFGDSYRRNQLRTYVTDKAAILKLGTKLEYVTLPTDNFQATEYTSGSFRHHMGRFYHKLEVYAPPTQYVDEKGVTQTKPHLIKKLALKDRAFFNKEDVPVVWRVDTKDWSARLHASKDILLPYVEDGAAIMVVNSPDDATFDRLIAAWGDPPWALVSSLPDPPPNAKGVPAALTKRDLNSYLMERSGRYWRTGTKHQSGFYVLTNMGAAYRTKKDSRNHTNKIVGADFLQVAEVMGLLGTSGEVHGALTAIYPKITKCPDWKDYFVHVIDPKVKELMADEEVLEWLARHAEFAKWLLDQRAFMKTLDTALAHGYPSHPLAEEVAKFSLGKRRPALVQSLSDPSALAKTLEILGVTVPKPANSILVYDDIRKMAEAFNPKLVKIIDEVVVTPQPLQMELLLRHLVPLI